MDLSREMNINDKINNGNENEEWDGEESVNDEFYDALMRFYE
jgi:hypothetical protein